MRQVLPPRWPRLQPKQWFMHHRRSEDIIIIVCHGRGFLWGTTVPIEGDLPRPTPNTLLDDVDFRRTWDRNERGCQHV